MKPYYEHGGITIYHGDCRDVSPMLRGVELVVTDPPYPDDFVDEYHYEDGLVDVLDLFRCRQFVFWSGAVDFPLSFTAAHIWNKNPSNAGAQYERIFERHGGKHRKVFTYYMINSTVAASFAQDVFTGHRSQKPVKLLKTLIGKSSGLVCDPFMGSGSTLRAAKDLGVPAVGIEREERYCEIAARRLQQEALPLEVA